ncbi:hypothetical protein [Pseudoclavibacter sp. JSM 162008]|jgi:hypothetical protein|uniref:hypothetical protein n=1 Tax=Pseudoclavibacter sp. JSM 162008 TaxID=3229855 RepID=UPI003525B88E
MLKQRLRVERGLPGFWLVYTLDQDGQYGRTVTSCGTGVEAIAVAGVIVDHYTAEPTA